MLLTAAVNSQRQILPPLTNIIVCFMLMLCRCWLGVCLADLPSPRILQRTQRNSLCSLCSQPRPHCLPVLHDRQAGPGLH